MSKNITTTKTNWLTLLLFFSSFYCFGQYQDYIGAGHDLGITVSSSSNSNNSNATNTINGKGMDAEYMKAARFLSQATFGYKMDEVERLMGMGLESWFNEQTGMPTGFLSPVMEEIWEEIYNGYKAMGYEDEDIYGPWAVHFNYTWWKNMMLGQDQLRQRVAYALSQILVISANSDLTGSAESMTAYYDKLLNHSFGNYEDLLQEVTLSVNMGYYLSHLNNPKEDLANNVHPDENYAREIMQLFTIGLYELNLDGSRKLDSDGNFIPTYDNDDIKELAQVFTGLGPGGINMYVDWTDEPYFGLGLWGADRREPMIMFDEWHDTSEKELIGGVTLPAGQNGMDDIEDAVNHLFNHPNVGPFLSRQLIQRLIKSNPTPGYIERVASVFNNNGQGVRGDLQAVVKAILFDQEARTCDAFSDPTAGRLREPMLKFTQLARTSYLEDPDDNSWNNLYDFNESTGQIPLHALTVFNFYTPDFQPVGDLAAANLKAPEFKLHDTRRSIGYINSMFAKVIWGTMYYSWNGDLGDEPTTLNLQDLMDLAESDTEELINYLDIMYTNGQLSDETRETIRTAVNGLLWGDLPHSQAEMALFLLLISPDYNISK